MDSALNFADAKELNHKYLGENNLEKKKILKDKLIIGTIPHLKKLIDDNYKDYNLGLYELDDLYNSAYELWINLLNQDILYQVKSFDDKKITNYIFDRLPSRLGIQELSYYMKDSLIVDSIYKYIKNNEIFDENEFQKTFREEINNKYNVYNKDEDKIFNYFFIKNYEVIKDVVKNYINSKKEVSQEDISKSIEVLSTAALDNSIIDNISVTNKTIEELCNEKSPIIKELLSGLTPLEEDIIVNMYGLDGKDTKSLLEISESYGEDFFFITEVYTKAIEKMKAYYYCRYGCIDKPKGK